MNHRNDHPAAILWLLMLAFVLAGCALTTEEKRDIARDVSTHNSDGTPRKPEDVDREIEEKGAEKKKSKGWGIALVILQTGLMLGSSLLKKGA